MLDEAHSSPLNRLRHTIDVLEKYSLDIKEALCYTHGAWDFDQVVAGILTAQLDLFALDNSILICQTVRNPNMIVYHVFIACGDLDEILEFSADQLHKEAALRGASVLSFEGRKGWKPKLTQLGWSNEMIVMYKEVDNGQG